MVKNNDLIKLFQKIFEILNFITVYFTVFWILFNNSVKNLINFCFILVFV